MAKPAIGARVMFCGHNGWFLADIWKVGNVNVVRASGTFGYNAAFIDALERESPEEATYQLVDFPEAGFWRPDLGVFVVPEAQVTEINATKKGKKK